MTSITLMRHLGKSLNEYGRFKAKYLYHRCAAFWGLSSRFRVYTFVLIFTKEIQKSNHTNSTFFSLKIVNRNKSGCQLEMTL